MSEKCVGIKKPIIVLRGEWNGVIYAKRGHGDEYVFADVKAKPEVRKVNYSFQLKNGA